MDYREGSIIRYAPFGGGARTVRVEQKEEDVKNGYPGFDGILVDDPSRRVWGYDDQILEIVEF